MKKALIAVSFLLITHIISISPPMYTVFAGGMPEGVGGSAGVNSNTEVSPIPEGDRILTDQDYQARGENTGNPKSTYVAGTVKGLQDNILTLETSEGVREFIVPQNGFVMRGNVSVPMSSLKPGEDISMYFNNNGNIESIEVGSPNNIFSRVTDNVRDIAAIGILSFVLAGIITHLITRRKDEESPAYRQPHIVGI